MDIGTRAKRDRRKDASDQHVATKQIIHSPGHSLLVCDIIKSMIAAAKKRRDVSLEKQRPNLGLDSKATDKLFSPKCNRNASMNFP